MSVFENILLPLASLLACFGRLMFRATHPGCLVQRRLLQVRATRSDARASAYTICRRFHPVCLHVRLYARRRLFFIALLTALCCW